MLWQRASSQSPCGARRLIECHHRNPRGLAPGSSQLTDVMYDTLKMCLTYLQTSAAAVMYDREGEGTFLFVMSDYDIYILDETLPGGMVHFENLRADGICENILGCYYADTIGWLNFANMNEQNEK